MAQEAGDKMQEGQENIFHLTSYRTGADAPLWQRKAADVISQTYQINQTMLTEEEFDFGKLAKNTYYHDLKSGKSVKSPEHIDDTIGGQLTSAKAREALAVFDRIDSQIGIGMKMSAFPMGKQGPDFNLIAEQGYGFSVWMLGKENEVNRIRQVSPQVAVIETFDMKEGTKAGTLYEVASGRTKPASDKDLEQIFANTSSPVVGMSRVKEIFAGLRARHPAAEPVPTVSAQSGGTQQPSRKSPGPGQS